MIALGVSYETGIFIHMALLGAGLVFYMLYCLYILGWNFTHDADGGGYYNAATGKSYPFDNSGEKAIMSILLAFLVGLMSSMVWPIVIPAIIIGGSLIAMRKFIRFQKKVDKAMDK